jgi:hypothetical protein
MYPRLAQRFTFATSGDDEHVSDVAMFGNEVELYYEFDAIMMAARRLYDTTRYLGRSSVRAST